MKKAVVVILLLIAIAMLGLVAYPYLILNTQGFSGSGESCTVYLSATAKDGMQAVDSSGRALHLNVGDEFEITASGQVKIGRDRPSVGPEGEQSGYWDTTVDSPFKSSVGGLEFSIGPLSSNRYFAGRQYRGVSAHSGVPTFRVIEVYPSGYNDDNSGGFSVTIKILRRA